MVLLTCLIFIWIWVVFHIEPFSYIRFFTFCKSLFFNDLGFFWFSDNGDLLSNYPILALDDWIYFSNLGRVLYKLMILDIGSFSYIPFLGIFCVKVDLVISNDPGFFRIFIHIRGFFLRNLFGFLMWLD